MAVTPATATRRSQIMTSILQVEPPLEESWMQDFHSRFYSQPSSFYLSALLKMTILKSGLQIGEKKEKIRKFVIQGKKCFNRSVPYIHDVNVVTTMDANALARTFYGRS